MSLTITGVIVTALAFVSSHFGLPFTEAELNTTVEVIIGFVGLLMSYVGRLRHGDVTWFGAKLEAE